MAINAALAQRFQANLLRKLAADAAPATTTPDASGEPNTKDKIKAVLYAYSPYVGGGAALGALLGGGIGYGAGNKALLGSLIGGGAGAALGGGGKYLYDRYGDKLFGKKAAADTPPPPSEDPGFWASVLAKIKAYGEAAKNAVYNDTTKAYAPYVGGAAALGAGIGGLVGSRSDRTLLGSILGGVGGAGLGVGGKYLYDKYGAPYIAEHFGKK